MRKMIWMLFFLPCLVWGDCSLLDSLEHLEDAKLAISSSRSPNKAMAQRLLKEQETLIDDYIDALDGMSKTQKRNMQGHLTATNKVVRDSRAILDEADIVYSNPGHHDVSKAGGNFRGGGDMTSHLPENHRQLFDNAVPYRTENGKVSFWTCSAEGIFHRFQGSIVGGSFDFHWNGSSAGTGGRMIRSADIPSSVKSYYRGQISNCK